MHLRELDCVCELCRTVSFCNPVLKFNLVNGLGNQCNLFPLCHWFGFDIKEILQSYCLNIAKVNAESVFQRRDALRGTRLRYSCMSIGVYQHQTGKHLNVRVHLTKPMIIHLRLQYNAFPSSTGKSSSPITVWKAHHLPDSFCLYSLIANNLAHSAEKLTLCKDKNISGCNRVC